MLQKIFAQLYPKLLLATLVTILAIKIVFMISILPDSTRSFKIFFDSELYAYLFLILSIASILSAIILVFICVVFVPCLYFTVWKLPFNKILFWMFSILFSFYMGKYTGLTYSPDTWLTPLQMSIVFLVNAFFVYRFFINYSKIEDSRE